MASSSAGRIWSCVGESSCHILSQQSQSKERGVWRRSITITGDRTSPLTDGLTISDGPIELLEKRNPFPNRSDSHLEIDNQFVDGHRTIEHLERFESAVVSGRRLLDAVLDWRGHPVRSARSTEPSFAKVATWSSSDRSICATSSARETS